MIIENRKIGMDFQDLSIGDIFKVSDYEHFYLKIQEAESGYNSVNLNTNKLTGFGGQCNVHPVNAKLIITS